MQYHQHNQRQREMILLTARKLFVEQGIEAISLGAIANECGISRATIYRYFKNKDCLLWSIVHYQYQMLGSSLHEKLNQCSAKPTTLVRYTIFFQQMMHTFQHSPEAFLFMGAFDSKYQAETASLFSSEYQCYFHSQDFKTKDTVKFLEEDFFDGSVRAELNPHAMAVSAVYLAFYTLVGICKDEKELSAKYSLKGADIVRVIFRQFLYSICDGKSDPPML